jgi:dGTPase
MRVLVGGQIGIMVNDAMETTRARLAGVGSAEDVRAAPQALAAFSPAMAEQERRLKRFMYANLYHHAQQKHAAERGRNVIAKLFAAYHQDAKYQPEPRRVALPPREPGRSRHIADFIAGMTDYYAIERYREIFGKAPRGLSNV